MKWKENVLSKTVSFFLVLQFPGEKCCSHLKYYLYIWLLNSLQAKHAQARTHGHTHTQHRIHMDHTFPKGPYQLGQLSKMYTIAKARQLHLQQYPLTEKLPVPCMCCVNKTFSFLHQTTSLRLPQSQNNRSLNFRFCSLYPFLTDLALFLPFYFPKRRKKATVRGTDIQKELLLKSFLMNRPL